MKTKYLSILSIVAVLILSGFSFAHAQSDVFTQNLYYGLQNNSQVTQLQEFLTSQNLYSGPITGNYYFLTIGAVKAFQAQQGITPAAGYFGPITMAAANKIADATVSASNNEAITETGTSTPPVVMASTTPQLQLAALMQEVALLEQQLQAQQSSTQQQSQTLQQIAQNTTPPVATVPAPTPTQPQTSTAAPTTRLTVNGSTNSITIPYGTATNISWSSTNASSCNISPLGWSGLSGNQGTGNLTVSQTYSLSCSGAGGSTSASVTVNVSANTATATSTPTPTSTPITQPPAIVVSLNTSTNPPTACISDAARWGNALFTFALSETANKEDAKIVSIVINDSISPSGANPSFQNLTLWDGAIEVASSSGPVPSGSGYTYTFTPLPISNYYGGSQQPSFFAYSIPQGGMLGLMLKGDLSSSDNVSDGSSHTFSIASASSIVASGASSGLPATIQLSSQNAPISNSQTIVSSSTYMGVYNQSVCTGQ